MQVETFKIYLELFTNLYKENKIEVNWRENPMTFRINVDVADYLKKINPEFKEDEFIKTIFKIIEISKIITTESNYIAKDSNQEFIDLVFHSFLSEPSFRSNIATQILTNGSYIDGVHYEVLTKRERTNLQNILGYSALLNIDYKNSSKTNGKVLLELNEEELSELIKVLENGKEDIISLSKLE